MFTDRIRYRWIVAFTIFFYHLISYMLRVNLSVNIVAMVPTSNVTYDHSQVILDWTPFQKAQVLSCYFWGTLVSNLFGGVVASRYGPRIVILLNVIISGLLTLVSPAAAKHSYMMMLIVRTVLGFSSGFIYPALCVLVTHWAVLHERGTFLGALIGGNIGTFVTWALCGVIIESLGWEWAFYVFGILALVSCLPLWLLTYDTPDDHPLISLEEKEYINKGTQSPRHTKRFPPYGKIMKSLPVWSLLIINFGTGWGIYFVITAAPSYLSNALGYKISATGALSGIIYLCRSGACFVFGAAGDILLKRNILSLPALRRLATVASHIIPGVILISLTISGYSPDVYVVLIIVVQTLNGHVTVSSAANPYDITSNFVGAMTGMAATAMTTAGIVSPFVTAYFTKDNENSVEAWMPVFYTGSVVYILTGLQFIIFGSTKKEPWDEIEKTEKENNENVVHEVSSF